ncbi:hypothetical protein [Pseudonocardia phyllosphaerae]|uniref:hypothetical protein n=1 Tax=Pseudonocardia phyllosphaerae TaxID=3390502 RepID=UPI003979AE44
MTRKAEIAGNVLLLVILAIAVVLWFVGYTGWPFVLMLLSSGVSLTASLLRQRNQEPIGEVDPELTDALRARRDADGEVAAIRELRRHRPKSSLVDATNWVRSMD